MTRALTKQEYLNKFEPSKRRDALNEALEIRKFEIGLYWQRATYFWAFIAAAFGGYFVIQDTSKSPSETNLSYVVLCLGFIFSLGWYFVNRGSKAWQQNWEHHVDLLEEEKIGPLYKTVLADGKYKALHFWDAYPFSPSKINQLLSLFVCAVWLVLIGNVWLRDWPNVFVQSVFVYVMSVLTYIASVILCWSGRSDIEDRQYILRP